MNGYNFTDRVRKVLQMAREEAARLHHEYVGTEHILLGLIREGEGVAAAVLTNLNVDLEEIQQKIEETVKKGKAAAAAGPDLPYTSRAKKVLELAMSEARELNHSYVGTEHLLLGLLREQEGVAAQVLMNLGVKLEQVRAEVLVVMGKKDRPVKSAAPKVAPKPPAEDLSDLPPELQDSLRELGAAIDKLNREKNDAVAAQDFEKAAWLRDRADRLKKERESLIRRGRA
jgi:ATP-dependent Clp protease ATP-binding subunit ClpC